MLTDDARTDDPGLAKVRSPAPDQDGSDRGGPGGGRLVHVPRIAAVLMLAVALLTAVAAVNVAARQGVEPVRSLISTLVVPAPANLAYSAFLLMLATATARRKRVAYWILLSFMSLQLLSGVAVTLVLFLAPDEVDLDPDTSLPAARVLVAAIVVLQAAAVVMLVRARRQFYARVQKASVRKASGVFLGVLLIAALLGFALVSAFPGSLTTTGERATWSLDKVTGGAFNLDLTQTGRAPGWVNFLLGLLGAVALFAGLFVLLRSQRAASVLHPEQETRLRALLAGWGEDDSLGYFATRRDKAVVFSRSGKAAITHRVVLGVSLASGDPLGDPEAWRPAIDAWLAQARAHGWIPAVMGAGQRGATAYARAGLKVLEIGDEAVLQVDTFDLEAAELRPVRRVVRRLLAQGWTVRIRRHGDIPAADLAEIAALSQAWRVGGTERGFSMALSRLGDPADARCVLVEALDPTGRPLSVLSFVPWGARGLSLDLMRRHPDAGNGVGELMVAELAGRAGRLLGVGRVSLNFAVFRSAFEDGARIGAGPVARSWRRVLLLASRWWQLESLYRANAKYQPDWVPRFLCFAERRELVKISLASAVAEGFLTVPGRGGRLTTPNLVVLPTDPGPPGAVPLKVGGLGDGAGDGPGAGTERGRRSPEQVRLRLATLARIRASGIDPYPVEVGRTASCAEVTAAHHGLAADAATGTTVTVAGRVLRVRDHGAIVFVTLRDWSGDLQLILTAAALGVEERDRFTGDIDLGDHVGVTGEVVASRSGELSVLATGWQLTGKCLRPLPDKHRGLTDPEARVRQRYLDLVVRPQARHLLRARSEIVHSLRDSLRQRGYLEVETPQLQRVHGGAAARPFSTHLTALDLTLYLRIAPELYLKRLCVGGVERVFELGRTFRNEGMSHKHNPEFTMLEAYQAYADYRVMLELTRELVQAAAVAAYGVAVARVPGPLGSVVEHDLSGDWPVVTVNDAISAALGEPVTADTRVDQLVRLCRTAGIPSQPGWSRGAVILEMYERLVEERTTTPTFYLDFPTDVSPLTRQHRDDPRLAERWDLVAFGTELGTAYSELVDPVEQRRRLTEQSLLAAGGDPEAMELDEDFLTALEYGMPPSGGMGMGVDRLVMTLTGGSIRDTLPFPLVRAHR